MNIGYRKPYCARENCLNGRNTEIESIDQTEKQSPRITDPACLTRLRRVIYAGSSTSLFCQFNPSVILLKPAVIPRPVAVGLVIAALLSGC